MSKKDKLNYGLTVLVILAFFLISFQTQSFSLVGGSEDVSCEIVKECNDNSCEQVCYEYEECVAYVKDGTAYACIFDADKKISTDTNTGGVGGEAGNGGQQ